MITQLVIVAITTLIAFSVTSVHADHIDKHVWIETAEGKFVFATEAGLNTKNKGAHDSICSAQTQYTYTYTSVYRDANWVEHKGDTKEGQKEYSPWTRTQTNEINGIEMINQNNGCGDEENYLKNIEEYMHNNAREITNYADDVQITSIEHRHDRHHECICEYWYTTALKDEYTYTVLDIPRDRELPPNYTEKILTGTKAGFDRWGDLNDIDFRYTDSRLEANIIIQPQIGDGKQYGNVVIGCLFENNQCTIQLFPDANVGNQQTLVNSLSIEWTIAHEFGHLIGLPHHIDPNNIMNTIHAKDVRTYYEVGGINVPDMVEPTYEQRLLENENNNTYTTGNINIDEIMNHETTKEFIEYMKQTILQNTPQADRVAVWFNVSGNIFEELFGTLFR